jgi:prephenate dehydrogenase
MTIQITIIGLGQIGASIGLALAKQKSQVLRVGNDRDWTTAQKAERLGAVDRLQVNQPAAVSEADLVLLALPQDQIPVVLEVIVHDLKEGAVVMDTAPVKGETLELVKKVLPEGRYYVGLVPAIGAEYIEETKHGSEAAHADLFEKSIFAIVSLPGTPYEAIQLGADLCTLMGAGHLFMDAAESDGIMANTHVLPQVLAAALLNFTVGQPGWRDGSKFCGKAYALNSLNLAQMEGPAALSKAALDDRLNLMRSLDTFSAYLGTLRKLLENKDETRLADHLQAAAQGRERWMQERSIGDYASQEIGPQGEMPSMGEALGRLVGIKPRSKKK